MPRRKSLVSIRTIASRAGVSSNTVSLALRGGDRVRDATRRKITRLARQLGCHPNLLARAVATSRA